MSRGVLGSIVFSSGVKDMSMHNRVKKTRGAFVQLRPIWK